jgi:hypothetical protein
MAPTSKIDRFFSRIFSKLYIESQIISGVRMKKRFAAIDLITWGIIFLANNLGSADIHIEMKMEFPPDS